MILSCGHSFLGVLLIVELVLLIRWYYLVVCVLLPVEMVVKAECSLVSVKRVFFKIMRVVSNNN